MDNPNVDEIIRDLISFKREKTLIYWGILTGISIVILGILTALMKTLGIFLATVGAIVYILNRIGNDAINWQKKKKEDAERSERLAAVEARKTKRNETVKTVAS